MNNVQEVVTDTKQEHIEADLKAILRHGDDPARRAVMREATWPVPIQSQPQRETHSNGK
jgi:hypothetical protein